MFRVSCCWYLYENKYTNPDGKLAKRCLDYKNIEKSIINYKAAENAPESPYSDIAEALKLKLENDYPVNYHLSSKQCIALCSIADKKIIKTKKTTLPISTFLTWYLSNSLNNLSLSEIAKLGLANAIGIVALLTLGVGYYVGYVFLRVLLSALLWSGFGPSFLISLSGCILACIFTLIFYYFRRFSIYGVSVIGAVMHGVGQVIMVSFMYGTVYLFLYMIVMAIAGIITGMLVAYISSLVIKRIEPKYEKTES